MFSGWPNASWRSSNQHWFKIDEMNPRQAYALWGIAEVIATVANVRTPKVTNRNFMTLSSFWLTEYAFIGVTKTVTQITFGRPLMRSAPARWVSRPRPTSRLRGEAGSCVYSG